MNNKSTFSKTWFVDIDGTILQDKTNDEIDKIIEEYGDDSYLHEVPIQDSIDFFRSIPKRDRIVLTTARTRDHINHTIEALDYFKMPYDDYVFDLGSGPRILVNDIKPKGNIGNTSDLDTAYSINVERNEPNIKYQYKKIDGTINYQMEATPMIKQLINE